MQSIEPTSERHNTQLKSTQSTFNKKQLNRIIKEQYSVREVYDKASSQRQSVDTQSGPVDSQKAKHTNIYNVGHKNDANYSGPNVRQGRVRRTLTGTVNGGVPLNRNSVDSSVGNKNDSCGSSSVPQRTLTSQKQTRRIGKQSRNISIHVGESQPSVESRPLLQAYEKKGGLDYNGSAATLRSPNLRFSFSRGARPNPQVKNSQDLFYDLPSSFKSKNACFGNKTESRDPVVYLRNTAGFHSPSCQKYVVKRLFDSIQPNKTKCTFGIPYENYRNVVIGSSQFLGKDSYPSGSTKLKQVSEKIDHDRPGFKYDLGTTLKSRDYNLASSERPDLGRVKSRAIVTAHSQTRGTTMPDTLRRSIHASIQPYTATNQEVSAKLNQEQDQRKTKVYLKFIKQ